MQKIDNLCQGLLGLILASHILKGFAGFRLHVYFRVALAKGHGIAAHFLLKPVAHELPDSKDQQEWKNPGEQETDNGGCPLLYNLGKGNFALVIAALGGRQTVDQVGIVHFTGAVNRLFTAAVLCLIHNFIVIYFNRINGSTVDGG